MPADVVPGGLRLRPRWLLAAAAVSLASMPITAVWSLFVAFAVIGGSAIRAAAIGGLDARERTLSTGLSAGFGLLAGPVVYLGLAVMA